MSNRITLLAALSLCTLLLPPSSSAFHNGGLVELSVHQFTWTDPVSQGTVSLVEEVFEGCMGVDPAGVPFFNPHDMTFVYVVANQSYNPQPGVTNGFSGFQIIFNQPIPELYNQQSPAVGGPWAQNAFSGQFPPWGVEWDVQAPVGPGIMPGQIGIFSFCTAERVDVIVNSPPRDPIGQGPNGWAHTWTGFIQTFIFNGPNSIPDDPWVFLAEECDSDAHIVCKKVKYLDDDRDGVIEVGEPVWFLEVIQVHNPSPSAWRMTKVWDRWGAEIDVEIRPLYDNPPAPTTAALTTKGKSAKEFLRWDIGTLGPGQTVNLVLDAHTDLNPAGKQEYTSSGIYEFNSGVVLKFKDERGKQQSFETDSVLVRVE